MPPRELKAHPVTIHLSPDLQAKLDACRPAGRHIRCPLDEEKQAALLEYWDKLNRRDLAKALGISPNTMLNWYRKLTAPKSGALPV